VDAGRLGELAVGDAPQPERPELGVRVPPAHVLHTPAQELVVRQVEPGERDGVEEVAALGGVLLGDVAHLGGVVHEGRLVGV